MDLDAKVVRVGTWLYDASVEKAVRIIRQNWDYYYEEGYSIDPPDLNADGYAFYAVYGAPWLPEPGSPSRPTDYFSRSRTCRSLDGFVEVAETTIAGPITWGRLPAGEQF